MVTNKIGAFLLPLAFIGAASAAPMLTNGGFESGNLTGWTVVNNTNGGCGTNTWGVNSTGANGCTNNVGNRTAPIQGSFAAYNTFDGSNTPYYIAQQFNVPNSVSAAVLSFYDTFEMNYSGQARSFRVDLYDAANTALLGNIYTVTPGFQQTQDWLLHTLDVTSLLSNHAGTAVTLRFSTVIPQSFTGPAAFGLDGVSLDVQSVPEPGTLALVAAALLTAPLVRRKKKQQG